MQMFRATTVPAGSAAASSSSSIPLNLPLARNSDWELAGELYSDSAVSSKYVRTNSSTLSTHLSAGEAIMGGGKVGSSGKGRKRNKGKGELNLAVGNEGKQPWLKQLVTRNVEIDTVETFAITSLITSNIATPQFAAVAFTIASVTDFTAFSAVFDQYRIKMIEVLIQPSVTEVTAPGGDVGSYISAVDIDDANVPTSLADLGSYSSVVNTSGTEEHYHRWTPSVAVAVYSGAFTSFAATTSLWLDCGSPNIQHYGLKVGTGASTVAQNYFYQVRLHCQWRARH